MAKEILSYVRFAETIKNNLWSPLYIFWGEETYLIERAVRAIKKGCVAPGCEEMDVISGDWSQKNMAPDTLREWTATPPFLSSKRVIILKDSGILQGKISEAEMPQYIKVLSGLPDSVCLVLWEEKIDKRKKKLLEQMQNMAVMVHVPEQSHEDLVKWIAAMCSREGLKITRDAVNSLVDRAQNDMSLIEQEVKKLILYCLYQKKTSITIAETEEICISDVRGSVFQMTDAIGMRDPKTAMRILDRLLVAKEPVTRIRFMLARHLRQLLCASDIRQAQKLASVLSIPPFAAQKLVQQASYFTMEEIKELYLSCAENDYKVKTGQIEELMSLQVLLCRSGIRV